MKPTSAKKAILRWVLIAVTVLANLVMSSSEFTLNELSLQIFGLPFQQYRGENWKRYLHDYFITWNQIYEKFLDFKTTMNNIKSNIKFTMKYTSKYSFHVWTFDYKRIQLTNCNRLINPKQCLLLCSCHTKHTKINISFNLAKRICTVISATTTGTFTYKISK